MEDLIRVIYVSAASLDISEHDTVKFLNEARKANRRNDISGMMLYIDGCFLLSLEGQAARVDVASREIFSDKREMRMILREPIAEREFPEWIMGFRKRSSCRKPSGCSANRSCWNPAPASPAWNPTGRNRSCRSSAGAGGNRIAAACFAPSAARRRPRQAPEARQRGESARRPGPSRTWLSSARRTSACGSPSVRACRLRSPHRRQPRGSRTRSAVHRPRSPSPRP